MNDVIKKHLLLLGTLLCLTSKAIEANEVEPLYPEIVEKIIFYKEDKFKLFYGGPIDRKAPPLHWMSIIALENEDYKTRAVYEISFINCNFHTAEGASLLFIKTSDANIKLKNTLSDDHKVLCDLLDGKYSSEKYIVVRQVDTAIVYYPEVFISESCTPAMDKLDRINIAKTLHRVLNTKEEYIDYYNGGETNVLDFENEQIISYKPSKISINFEGKDCEFTLTKKILKDDKWKLYYLISKNTDQINHSSPPLIRIDSGCVSGQIYDDEACDCLDQLHEGLLQISKELGENSLLIHVPAHDGRGFGTAPKAETEIYKRGGRGRVHTTKALDTISAAKLLYGTLNYDLRTYDGAAKILKSMNIDQVVLLTDNRVKVDTLEKNGIQVVRKKTGTEKNSCIQHIKSKKESENYFKN